MSANATAEKASPGLEEIVFGSGEMPVFAVLDGASSPELVKNLYAQEPEYCCLYRGQLAPDIAVVAPYLVRLEPGSEFARWVLTEGWGAHWGMFLTSGADLRALRNHFREFLRVELPDRRTALFRFYDPRVLRGFLPVSNETELEEFFGPVRNFVVEGDSAEQGFKFARAGKALKPEPFKVKKPA